MYEILKPFGYSTDGVTCVRFQIGDPPQAISDDLSPGLISEEFIKAVKGKK